MIFKSFTDWVETEVLPLRAQEPERLRLDGWQRDGNREIVARFRHAGRVWQVHGDTRIGPVLQAYEAIRDGSSSDPFVTERAKTRDSLNLAPALRQRPKHFYVYEEV
jgi:hypothetical protein